jgi:hypothetical protein
MAQLHSGRRALGGAGGAAASLVGGPAAFMKQGIRAHAGRGGGGDSAASPAPAAQNAVSSGIAAHGSRGGGTGAGAAAPPPASPSSTPHARTGNEA